MWCLECRRKRGKLARRTLRCVEWDVTNKLNKGQNNSVVPGLFRLVLFQGDAEAHFYGARSGAEL